MSEVNSYQEDDTSKLAGELFSGKLGVEEALVKLRTRLLDLTMRNRLLNYRHPKGRSFQFTDDPDLNLLFERLQDGKSVPVAFVPDPSIARYDGGKKPEARIYARDVDIGTSIDISQSHSSLASKRLPALQVIQYPADLERMMRKVSTEARTVIEETGTNMLYLMFGFLEYFDSDDSDKAVHAPLLSVPITLNRGNIDPDSRTYTYEIAYSGEDIAENFTLREKLRQQFRLEFPELEDEDTPEDYFRKIQSAVDKRKNWTVKRRLSLGFLSFGKLAIWADLDPAKSGGLLESELLRNIFEGGRAGASDAFHAEDYDIDAHDDGELPLIYDADSSQHSAIIDVKNGKSLVINGPPGTGKSQTITNIVASAIADGKKVLFVSEKLAALEVVKQRLTGAGLGDFCLELHSHKTQKKQLLESIEQRMTSRYVTPAGYSTRIDVLRERRKGLNAYAELLGSRIGSKLDLTVHEVFWATEKRRRELDRHVETVSSLNLNDASAWSVEKVDRCRTVLSDAAAALGELGYAPDKSPWLGFRPNLLIHGDELAIAKFVDGALEYARKLQTMASELESNFSIEGWSIQAVQHAKDALETLSSLPAGLDCELTAQMFPCGIESIEKVASEAERLFQLLAQINELRNRADMRLKQIEIEVGDKFSAVAVAAQSVLIDDSATFSVNALKDFKASAETLIERLSHLSSIAGGRQIRLPRDVRGLQEQLKVAQGWMSSTNLTANPALDLTQAGEHGLVAAQKVRDELVQIESVLKASSVPFAGKVEELQVLLDGRGMPELLPNAVVDTTVLDDLRRLTAGGWGSWTAEQFSSKSREINEYLSEAKLALDDLKDFFSKVGIPVNSTRSNLEGVEVLLLAAEAAPKELLSLRGSNIERPDFADVAFRAEDAFKSVTFKATKVFSKLHLDTLPSDVDLVRYVKVFRRGNSIFNFLKADWRQAKAAFNSCVKEVGKYDAAAMGEHFSAALSWKTAETEFTANDQFKTTLGVLFDGVKTDFSKIRRLHTWHISSAPSLLTSDFSSVNLNSLPEQYLMQLAANAARVRSWIGKLNQLPKVVAALPGLDPALQHARRLEELFVPLNDCEQWLKRGADVLRQLVVPAASAKRAADLVELKRRVSEHTNLLVSLIAAPKSLSLVAEGLGLPTSTLMYQDLSKAVVSVESRSRAILDVGEAIGKNVGSNESLASSLEVLGVVDAVEGAAGPFLTPIGVDHSGTVSGLVSARQGQAHAVMALIEYLAPNAKPGFSAHELIGATQSALDSIYFMSAVEGDKSFANAFGPYLLGLNTNQAAIALSLDWAGSVKAIASKLPLGATKALLGSRAKEVAAVAGPLILRANDDLASYRGEMASMGHWGKLDWVEWGGSPFPVDAVSRLESAKTAVTSLLAWSKFLASRDDAKELGVSDLLNLAESGKLPFDFLVSGFEFVFYKSLTRGIISTHRELSRFTGAGHERLRADFAEMDKELIALNGAMYAAKVDKAKRPLTGVSAGRAGDLTEMSLLSKEVKKQKRHVPIRQLLRRAGRSLQELKPCFMMGPLSVAQYLEQGQLHFDLLVMDEASQLRPEDALGAIARCKQLVVVGDPKQLPPTNFFDRLMDGDDEDPEDAPSVVDGVESILGICEHLYRPVRTLRWHYRSRHESLIAFSNNQFYDGRLVVFPSPFKRSKRLGVNYRYVKEGVYQDRRNIPEAQRVVDAVMEHMLTCPEESLGVVTLNQTQRELIEDMLDKKIRDVKGVAEYLAHHESAGWKFFVKNLENVQGDERDVIFVSTTFGKPAGSTSVRQNFGPINRPDGWRRLNVLFTRARKRLDLFTSMLPTDVQADEKVSLGRRALREYLDYAKTGVLQNVRGSATDREADSDFEVAVASALRQEGYEVEPQVGVAGYFIDLGVRHSERKSEFIAGIECDGVTYHSSLSARDRDRIRQEVLESLGWRGRIIRVWSTDWFADPRGQTQRLLDFLKGREQFSLENPAEDFDDEIVEDFEPEVLEEVQVALEKAKADDGRVAPEVEASEVFADIGDRITYETLEGVRETHTVQIVDSPSNLRLGLLNDETPLAEALLGLKAGEESVLHVPGQVPRRLRVLEVIRQAQSFFERTP
jgi:very-short-patch-repair endonuclease